jgi:glycosyltransferase involved in cell wall biosynthesis
VSLIEAGAAGVPAVAPDVGGVSDVVTPDTGVLVPPGDEGALGDAIARLVADPGLRAEMGVAGRAHVLERYAAERLVSDVTSLYEELLDARRQPFRGADQAIFTGSKGSRADHH